MNTSPLQIFRSVIFALFLRELKTRFGESRLGYAWIVLEPMLHIVMLLVIFSVFSNQMMPQVPFSLFLITGLIPFFLFKHIAMALMGSIPANLALFSYKPVKPFSVYITRTILEVLIYGAIFGLILVVFWWFSLVPFSIAFPLELIGTTVLIILFSVSIGIALSVLVHKFESLRMLVNIAFTLLYFLSGIMYPLWVIPSEYLRYLQYNPLLHLIEMFRESFFSYYPQVEGISLTLPFWTILVMGYIGMWFYTKRESLLRSST
ncbi:ABC transporter permease [Sulfuricurvum sp.]|uniref:ABC transporter permease n=1 Tax=Sulfuricurvum sp. TaxID=2025608 RepID=UPI002E338B32|nr:ABC transporter permease [Sulfuricurvum sp.]HEX5329463.1 ABC transporter permease [Sulfuricurvum sp.]